MSKLPKGKSGAALIESCIVIIMLCIIVFGLLQISYIIASRNVLSYTSFATSRAAAIGLNDFMLLKVSRYASIPTSGPINRPSGLSTSNLGPGNMGDQFARSYTRKYSPESAQGLYEVAVKRDFHLADIDEYRAILNYDNWDGDSAASARAWVDYSDNLVYAWVAQSVPMTFPFARLFARHLTANGSMVSVPRTIPQKEDGEWYTRRETAKYPAVPVDAMSVMEDHAVHYLKPLK